MKLRSPAPPRHWLSMWLLILAASPAASEVSWSLKTGVIGGEGARGLRRRETDYAGTNLEARLIGNIGPGRVVLRAITDAELSGQGEWQRRDSEIQEASYEWSMGAFDLAVGRLRLPWGKADGINPTDVWTPRAYDRPALLDVDQYRGADTVRVSWSPGETSQLTLLALPHFRRSNLGAGLFRELPSRPSESSAVDESNPGWALRYETTGEALDYSLTVVDSAESFPYFRPVAGGFQARYGRLRMVGADAAYARGSWVYRAEAALRHREDDALQLAPATSLDAVFGVERELREGLIAIFQVLSTSNLHDRPSLRGPTGPLGLLNRTTFHQGRASYTGGSLSFTFRPADQRGDFNLSYVAYNRGEQFLRLRVQYPLFERCQLGVLVEEYRGPLASLFNRLERNNIAWLSLSISLGNI